MEKKYNITLTEDQMITLANLLVTLDCNQDELKKLEDSPSDGLSTVWECLEAPIETLQHIVSHWEQ